MKACLTPQILRRSKAIQQRYKLNFSHNFCKFQHGSRKKQPQQREQEIKPGELLSVDFKGTARCRAGSMEWLKFLLLEAAILGLVQAQN